MKYLLDPKVYTATCNMLTPEQFRRLLTKLKSKKFGSKIVAIDAEEIVTTATTTLTSRYHWTEKHLSLPPGNYFNVHVEYVL